MRQETGEKLISFFPFPLSPRQGFKGDVGISGEQGIPGPPVRCGFICSIYSARLKLRMVLFCLMLNYFFLTFLQGSDGSEGLPRNDGS